jgi:hypothetical protein
VPLVVSVKPTAVQAAAETHETPSRTLLPDPRLGLGTSDQVRACALAPAEPARPALDARAGPGPGRALPLALAANATTMAIATAALTTGHRNIPAVFDLGKLCIMTPWRYPGGQAHRPAHIWTQDPPGARGTLRRPEGV